MSVKALDEFSLQFLERLTYSEDRATALPLVTNDTTLLGVSILSLCVSGPELVAAYHIVDLGDESRVSLVAGAEKASRAEV